ncbi:MAG: hypothetical protein AABW88_03485 [Nanoarchaeota archaeon]
MKKAITLFMVLLLIFVAGCAKKTETNAAGKAFVGGTQGLAISFLPNLPPTEVFDTDNPFSISVKLENKGEFDIPTGAARVSITGIRAEDFRLTSNSLLKSSEEDMGAVRIDAQGNIVAGGYTTMDFPEMNYATKVSGSLSFPVRASVCYEYGTNAQGQLCVRKDLRGVTGQASVCDPNRQVPAENSGAPVQITNIRQNVAGSNKIDFFFTIKQMGTSVDSLFKKGSKCDSALANRDVVFVEVEDPGLGTLTCSGLKDGTATSGYVTLFNGEREVRCSQIITNPEDVITPVKVSLTYGYKQFIDVQLKVKHAE